MAHPPSTGTVATDGGQGYENRAGARNTVEKVMAGHYDGPIEEQE